MDINESVRINLRDFDLWLLDNEDVSQEEREMIVETLNKFLKEVIVL